MKRYVLPKDYPDMEMDQFKIHLIDAFAPPPAGDE